MNLMLKIHCSLAKVEKLIISPLNSDTRTEWLIYKLDISVLATIKVYGLIIYFNSRN